MIKSDQNASSRLFEIAESSARGGFFLFTGNALSLLILAVGSIIVARLLGPEGYGLFALSLVVPSILVGFVDFGTSYGLIRFSAKFRAEGKSDLAASMLRSALIFRLITGMSMSMLCLVFSDAFATYIVNRPEAGFLIKLSSLLILFQTLWGALSSSFIGLDRMEGNALVMSVQAVVKAALSPLLIVLGFGVIGALTGHIASYLIAGLVGALFLLKCCRSLGRPSGNGFSSNLKEMLSYGFPLYLSALLGLVLGRYQTIVLAFFASNFEVGNFTIAANVSSMMSLLIFPLNVLFPAFSKVNPNGGELKELFKLAVKYSAMLAIPATVVIAILSRGLVYAFYGQSYSLAPAYLSLYILTFLYAGLGSLVLSHLFSGLGEAKVVLKSNLINLFSFLPLAPILTMFYRVPGLITAFLASSLLSLIYASSVATKRLKLSLNLEASLRICLASLLSAAPLLALLHFSRLSDFFNLIMGGSLYLFTYLTLTPLTGAVTNTDLENLKLIFSKIRILWPILKPILDYESKILSVAV